MIYRLSHNGNQTGISRLGVSRHTAEGNRQ
jgi:hypothetical protein